MDFSIILYIVFGILPSLIWLSYYLRKDVHPEPRKMILAIFFWGAAITLPVFFVQIGLADLLEKANLNKMVTALIYWFLVISLSEELFKYLVVRIKVINSEYLDEPLDVMLYMVIAALGFTAVENILYLFVPVGELSFNDLVGRTLVISMVRFIGATFLHTLCSATIGYYMTLSFCSAKNKIIYLLGGIFVAMTLHGLYDFSIMVLEGPIKIAIPITILVALAFLVFSEFEHLKKLKGICKIERVGSGIKQQSLKTAR